MQEMLVQAHQAGVMEGLERAKEICNTRILDITNSAETAQTVICDGIEEAIALYEEVKKQLNEKKV